jgi:beta-lysine 5,6-aminomutase alpha subunit
MDRYVALKSAAYAYRAWRSMGAELVLPCDGMVARRARETLGKALGLLERVAEHGLLAAIASGSFAGVARAEDGGKGLAGVVARDEDYLNPFLEILEGAA